MAEPIIPLIMCGGAGTRLWPASREGRPKQFLPLFGSLSTFQETLMRVSDPAVFGRPIVITNSQYRFIVAEQLAEAESKPISCSSRRAAILVLQSRRAPRLHSSAAMIRSWSRSPPIMSSPTQPPSLPLAAAPPMRPRDGKIVTFGVRADRPATEYGYIRPGAAIANDVFAVESFVEKPDAKTAESYVAQGLSLEFRQFRFPRRRLARRISRLRCENGRCHASRDRESRHRSRLCHARPRLRSSRRMPIRSITR